jgi:transposase
MRYELTEYEWAAINPMLPNKPRGVPRVRPANRLWLKEPPHPAAEVGLRRLQAINCRLIALFKAQ